MALRNPLSRSTKQRTENTCAIIQTAQVDTKGCRWSLILGTAFDPVTFNLGGPHTLNSELGLNWATGEQEYQNRFSMSGSMPRNWE